MKIPVVVKIALLLVLTTLFYTWVGSLVPQKEVRPDKITPPIPTETTTEELVELGAKIANGRGLCMTCHTIGEGTTGLRFPDLDGIATRAETTIPGLNQVQYLAQSLYEPDIYIVPGFNKGMPATTKAPIELRDDEIIAVIAWLQSLGGTADVTLETDVSY